MVLSQLKGAGKVIAGILLVSSTAFAVITILGYFPNKMPAPGKGEDAWYTNTRFKMMLIDSNSSSLAAKDTFRELLSELAKQENILEREIGRKREKKPVDSSYMKDSVQLKIKNDSIAQIKERIKKQKQQDANIEANKNRIHLNSILLILVASMGFLGNMIHIASSFTSFVGNGTFEKRWLLWYFVRPFTAAGLSIIIYFVIRAGFMGYGSDASSVNLYGILALSALAGLFTDNATLKLKEVFDVVFKPKDERGDKLTDKIKINSIKPQKIDVNAANNFEISGENFDKKKLTVKIDGTEIVKPVIKPKMITFSYTVAEADKQKKSFELTINDDSNNEIYKGEVNAV